MKIIIEKDISDWCTPLLFKGMDDKDILELISEHSRKFFDNADIKVERTENETY